MKNFIMCRGICLRLLARPYCQVVSIPPTPETTAINANVPGLSDRCVRVATEPVGPGATSEGEYKVPEYFCFSRMSYHEAEIELAKYRCPQPSAFKE